MWPYVSICIDIRVCMQFVGSLPDPRELDVDVWDRVAPLLAPLLNRTSIEVRKEAVFTIINLHRHLGDAPLAAVFEAAGRKDRKLLAAYMAKRIDHPVPLILRTT